MHIASRHQKWILWLGLLFWGMPLQGQDLNIQVGFSLISEMTTGSLASRRNDPMDFLHNSRFTYSPGINLRVGFLSWLGLETGLYQKDRGLGMKTPILDFFGNTVGHSNITSHYTYLGFPLKVHLKWEELYLSVGPSLELLTGFATFYNGQAIPSTYIPSRNMEIVLSLQFGWESKITSVMNGFLGINMDAQWLRPLQALEYRYASIGLVAGLRFGAPKRK